MAHRQKISTDCELISICFLLLFYRGTALPPGTEVEDLAYLNKEENAYEHTNSEG